MSKGPRHLFEIERSSRKRFAEIESTVFKSPSQGSFCIFVSLKFEENKNKRTFERINDLFHYENSKYRENFAEGT